MWMCDLKNRYKLFLIFLILLIGSTLHAAEPIPPELQEVGIDEQLGKGLSLDLPFKDEKGEGVTLRKYFDGKPVLLTLIYYSCPNLCNFLLNGLVDALKMMPWTVGDRFKMVSVSIDPKEGPEQAAAKKKSYLESYGRPSAETGWHFLTGAEAEIKKLAGEVGFRYKYDPQQKQYAHAAAVFVITPEGKISRYLWGIQFSPRDVRLSLLEATQGKIGNAVDRFLMFCYRYDPQGRKYALMATNLMKLGGVVTVVGLTVFLIVLGRGKKKEKYLLKPEAH